MYVWGSGSQTSWPAFGKTCSQTLGKRSRITEMDALIAYLQVLGTMVDFSKYNEGYFVEFR